MGFYDGEEYRHVDSDAYGPDASLDAAFERQTHNNALRLNAHGWQITKNEWEQRRHASVKWSSILTFEMYVPARMDTLEFWLTGFVDDREGSGEAKVYSEAALMGIGAEAKTLNDTGATSKHSWEYTLTFEPADVGRWRLFQFRIASVPTSVIESSYGQTMPDGEFFLDLNAKVHDSHAIRMKTGGLFDFLTALSWSEQGYGSTYAMHPGRTGSGINEGESYNENDYYLFECTLEDLSYLVPTAYSFEFGCRDDALAPVEPEAARPKIAYDAAETAFKHAINADILSSRPRPVAVGGTYSLPDSGTEWPADYPRKFGIEEGGFTYPDASHRFQFLPRETDLNRYIIRAQVAAFHLQPGYIRGEEGSTTMMEDAGRVTLRGTVTVKQYVEDTAPSTITTETFDQTFILYPSDHSGTFALSANAFWARYKRGFADGWPDEKWPATEMGYLFKDGHLFAEDIQFLTPVQYEFSSAGLTADQPAFVEVSWSVVSAEYRLLEGRSTDEIVIMSPGISCWEVT